LKLLETIRFEKGEFANLELHQQRMNASRKVLFNNTDPIELLPLLQASTLEGNCSTGFLPRRQAGAIRTQLDADLHSAKSGIKNPNATYFQIANLKEPNPLLQASTLEVSLGLFKCRIIYSKQIEKIEFIPYQLPNITSLKIVIDNEIDYSHKYLNRNQLEKYYWQKGNCDDILIVKNGLVTDTSFANILFYNGIEWLTPANPLLKGTQRQFLLETEQITTAEIRPSDLKYFKKARLVNAMIRFEDEVDVEMKSIC